ncbi:MAG TPA: right-handed parallel beta-helix repeat-containing protein [Gemmatimonadaceae bacterium]|nr:right-handed parallel beta-helix repeat-containing protein [Gemmatimonadaceae bacterium]
MAGLLGFLLARCQGGDSALGARSVTAIASVAVILGSDFVLLGETSPASVEVRNHDGEVIDAPRVSWKTRDPATAEVSIQGIISGMGHGTTEIVATVDGVSGTARVFVVDSMPANAAAANDPELPRDSVDVSWRPATGRTIHVRQGDNLQRALEQAQRGDELVLEAAATFRGHFQLPAKPGSAADGWITVRTSALDLLPAPGTRIDPARSSLMPKIVTPDLVAALTTELGASGWRLVGIEVTVDPGVKGVQQGLVLLGDGAGAQRSLQQVATDLILDRVYIHGHPNVSLKRCVALNSARTAIVDSQLLECHGKGFDSQAIATWTGPGPYRIENNRLEAAGEIIIFGGDTPSIQNLVPSDITIRRNYMHRPLTWKGLWTVKNLFELKNAQRVLVEGNILENNWADGQIGHAVVLGSADTGYPWCIVQDVTFRYNHIHNSAGGFNLFDHYGNALPMRRVAVKHNLLTNIGASGLGQNGRMFQLAGRIDDLAIENNTGFSPQIYVTFGDEVGPMARFTFRNNIGGDAEYPLHGGRANGAQAIALYTTAGSRFERNVIITRVPPHYLPPSNTYIPSRAAVGFDDNAGGLASWRLARDSRYRGAGTGASTPGANIDELVRRLAGVGGSNYQPAARPR